MLVAGTAGLGACEHGRVRSLVAKVAAAVLVVILVAALAVIGKASWDSRLPGTYSVMDYGTPEYGGGAEGAWHAHHGHGGGTSVADLHGPAKVLRRNSGRIACS